MSPTVGSDNDDCSAPESACRTINHAVQLVEPGQTIYVKAGDYGAENIVFSRSGTKDKPITLEGYQNTPGDAPKHTNVDGNLILDSTLMPLLHNNGSGTAILAQKIMPFKRFKFQASGFPGGR